MQNKMVAVISIVNAVLIKIALTLRFRLPGISPGAFKKAPIAMAGAYSKYPKKLRTTKGVITAKVNLIPL